MRFKFNWIISFCLVAFISLFNFVGAFASSANYKDYGSLDSYPNIVVIHWKYNTVDSKNVTHPHDNYYYIFSKSAINVTSYTSSSTNATYKVSVSNPHGDLQSSQVDTAVPAVASWSDSVATTTDGLSTSILSTYKDFMIGIYNVKGNNYNSDGSALSYDPSDSSSTISPDDILNYNWDGDGIKIYNLKPNMNVSGYLDQSIKYFDIETYGKFTYQGDDTFFTSFAYKKMQTSIQLASVVTYGSETRHAGEGLGIKDFKWISDTSHLKRGDEIRFRIVYQVPMLDKGTYDIKIGTTYNNGSSDLYMSDFVRDVIFLNSNWNYGEPMNNDGETGNVGNQPGNTPRDDGSSGGDSSNPYGKVQYILTEISSFSSFVGSLFSFLPVDVQYMFIGVCTIISLLMVKRAVF